MFLLLSTSCTPPPSLSRFLTTSYSLFFLIILCSLPVNWLLALPLDLWLTLFNPVYNKQKALGLKVCAKAESHHN